MTHEDVARVIGENAGKWIRITSVQGVRQFMFVVNVDDEGFVNKINADDEFFWTTFDDIEEVGPALD